LSSILIAGGGTGGHVFPGLAVARAVARLADVEIVFAGTPRGLESRVIPEAGYALELLDVEPMKGGGAERAIKGALVAAKATQRAREIIRRLKPAAVLSVGGYAAGPAALAGVSQRVPLAVLEPNSTLGLANRILAPFAKRAYLAWPETARHFRGDKARLFGVPLRPGFSPVPYVVASGPKRILVLGGSQGAVALNEVLPKALARVRESASFTVLHQAGRDREAVVKAAYGDMSGVEVVPFLEDIADRIAAADLIIGRSGAGAVAEVAAIGRAGIFVPFPHAADDHQAKNALSLEAVNGGICIRQDAADEVRLSKEIAALLTDDDRRKRMADAAREHGRPHAAEDIAKDLLALAGIGLKKQVPNKTNGATNGSSSHFKVGPKEKSS
jgi:UDP-N-acetylglucosamine--N-acetylmuramyl-(pentapeptide) pyrophosphoryl-undecaprenol N-acetylglucosamine transferase